MKKTLVALAAVAATTAFAQSSVTMYGLFDVAYGSTKSENRTTGTTYKSTGLEEGTTAGNRLGFRGTEDLGGGMKASFLIETAFSPTTGDIFGNRAATSGHNDTNILITNLGVSAASAYAIAGNSAYRASDSNRQSYVGLSGSFGEVRVGYQYNNLYVLSSLSGYLPGYEGAAGSDLAHTLGAAAVGGARGNGFTYLSPGFADGFSASVQYGSGQNALLTAAMITVNPASAVNPAVTAGVPGAEAKTARTSAMLNYANGPLAGSIAYTRQANTLAGVSQTGKLTQFGGRYNFGVASVNGLYNKGDNGAVAVVEYKSFQLGVKVPFGATAAFASYGKAEQTNAGLATKAVDAKLTQFGVEHTLSKRTMLYAMMGTTDNTDGTSAANIKGKSQRFGVRHTF